MKYFAIFNKKNFRQYFNCNEILEIFLTSFCNILFYVGSLGLGFATLIADGGAVGHHITWVYFYYKPSFSGDSGESAPVAPC